MRLLLLGLTLTLGGVASAVPCDHSIAALNRYEHDILAQASGLKTTGDFHKISTPLLCLFETQRGEEGLARLMAEKYLAPLFGAPQIAGLRQDPRLAVVAKYLEQLTLESTDPLNRSVVLEFSKGDWSFYQLFCEQGDVQFCATFLPDKNQVTKEQPLIAAASLMRLAKAYQVLKGKPREEVAERLKELYRDIPTSAKLKRHFIDQIYNDLFQTGIPLGMV